MTNLNRITILGNIGSRDPKAGTTQGGKPVTRLTVPTNKRYKDEDGDWKSAPPTWHNVVVYGPNAQYAGMIEPGSLVFIEGELTYREYQNEVDTPSGPVTVEKWPDWEIVASSITSITKGSNGKREKGEAA